MFSFLKSLGKIHIIWRIFNPCTLLVGMKNGTAFTENTVF